MMRLALWSIVAVLAHEALALPGALVERGEKSGTLFSTVHTTTTTCTSSSLTTSVSQPTVPVSVPTGKTPLALPSVHAMMKTADM
jgi:hypothetical protein